MKPRIFISTGDVSGFVYAERLVAELKDSFEIKGILPGYLEGSVFDSRELVSFGVFEIIKNIPRYKKALKKAKEFIKSYKPDCLLLIDFPGFNLKLAEETRGFCRKVFYFIPPKVWAWGTGRLSKIKALVDKVFVIFPFEVEIYRSFGIEVEFVGNPSVDLVEESEKKRIPKDFKIEKPFLIAMPGSRHSEIKALFEEIILALKDFNMNVVVPVAPTISEEFLKKHLPVGINPVFVPSEYRFEVMKLAKAGVVASGTASLEMAIAGIPHVVVYKVNPLTYLLAKKLVKTNFISLPNIILKEEVVPELIQREANRIKIRKKLEEVIQQEEKIRKKLSRIKTILKGGAIKMLAKAIKKEFIAGISFIFFFSKAFSCPDAGIVQGMIFKTLQVPLTVMSVKEENELFCKIQTAEGETLFITKDGKYLIEGSLYQAKYPKLSKEEFELLKNKAIFTLGKGKEPIVVITNPLCEACRKYGRKVFSVLSEKYKIYVVSAGFNKKSEVYAIDSYCNRKEPSSFFNLPSKPLLCESGKLRVWSVKKVLERHGLYGTPIFIFENGVVKLGVSWILEGGQGRDGFEQTDRNRRGCFLGGVCSSE